MFAILIVDVGPLPPETEIPVPESISKTVEKFRLNYCCNLSLLVYGKICVCITCRTNSCVSNINRRRWSTSS